MTSRLAGYPPSTTTATELFEATYRGEAAHLPFATIGEAMKFSEVSPACAAIAERFLAKSARGFRTEINTLELPRNRELSVLSEHFHEAEALVTRGFPGLTPEKRDVAIAKLFLSKLSYSMGHQAPLTTSNETGRATATTAEFIRTSQNLETLEKTIPFIDALIEPITSRMDETREKLTGMIGQVPALEEEFPGITAIVQELITGTYTRPTEEVVRAQLEIVQAAIVEAGIQENIFAVARAGGEEGFNQVVEFLVDAPAALTQGLNANNITVVMMVIMIPQGIELVNRIDNWNRIKELPSNTPEEIRIKVGQIREVASSLYLFGNQGASIDVFVNGNFTQILPEMAAEMQAKDIVRLQLNLFKRVPLLPPHIRDLCMAYNPLKSFENLLALSELQVLDLVGTGLQAVPSAVETIAPSLVNIDVSNNNLIEVPESFCITHRAEFSRRIHLYANPIIYLSPQLIYAEKALVNADRVGNAIALDMVDQPKSSLAKFYQYFVRPTSTYTREEAAEHLSNLSLDNRNLIFERVWAESGKPETSDAQWGEHHAFDDLSILARAARSAILTKFDALGEEEKATIYGRMNYIEGVDYCFSESNAKHNMTRLADALSFEVVDSPSNRPLMLHSLDYLKNLAKALSKIQEFNRTYPTGSTTLEPAEVLLKALRKLELHDLYNSFSNQLEAFKAALEDSGSECPYIISSLQSRAESEVPEFCKGPKAVLEAEVEAAKEAVRMIKRDSYLGTNYDEELMFISRNSVNSNLERLIRLFTEGPFSEETFREIFGSLSTDDKNSLLQHVWDLSPDKDLTLEDPEAQLRWAREHRLSDLRILSQAVQLLIVQKYNELPGDEKIAVDGRIYELAGSPETSDAVWGEHHALDSLSRLAAALPRPALMALAPMDQL